jgi:hypothetical protein
MLSVRALLSIVTAISNSITITHNINCISVPLPCRDSCYDDGLVGECFFHTGDD